MDNSQKGSISYKRNKITINLYSQISNHSLIKQQPVRRRINLLNGINLLCLHSLDYLLLL